MSDSSAVPSPLKIWLIATRAFSFPASVMPVILGTALSWHMGVPMRWGAFGLCVLGMLAFHMGSNLINDCYDYRRGLDRQVYPSSGAVVRGWITEQQALRIGLGCVAVGIGCGVALTLLAGAVVLGVGVLGVVILMSYTTERFCLKYAGMGDLAIFVTFGLLPVFGAFWVQAQQFSWQPVIWSLPLGLLTVGILHANNWRDIESDPENGCRTVAGLLGAKGARIYYRALVLLPFGLSLTFVAIRLAGGGSMVAPLSILGVLVLLPHVFRLIRIDRAHAPHRFIALDGATAQLQLMYGLLVSGALILSRLLSAPW